MSRHLPEVPEFGLLPKAEEASLRWTRQCSAQLMLEIRNLDLNTLPSPAHLPPSLTSSFLAGAGVVSVWSHIPADCNAPCPLCLLCLQQSTRNLRHYMM
jgi:hypothetical protein